MSKTNGIHFVDDLVDVVSNSCLICGASQSLGCDHLRSPEYELAVWSIVDFGRGLKSDETRKPKNREFVDAVDKFVEKYKLGETPLLTPEKGNLFMSVFRLRSLLF